MRASRCVASLVPGGERGAVRPRGLPFERDDLVGHAREERAVVADEQDRLRTGAQRVFEPLLARDVEVVVGLVEQEHVGVGPEQRPRARAASARRPRASRAAAPPAASNDCRRAIVVQVSQRTSASQPPASPHSACARASARPVRSPGARSFAASASSTLGRPAGPRGSESESSRSRTVRSSSRQPTSWRMTRSSPSTWMLPSATARSPAMAREQRRLPRAVRADERDVLAVTGAERHVAEQQRPRRGCDTTLR